MYKQYQLPYAYGALEPHIDALTMETHYSKHHAAYTKNLNDAAEKAGVAGREITELLANLDSITDSGLRKASDRAAARTGKPVLSFRRGERGKRRAVSGLDAGGSAV